MTHFPEARWEWERKEDFEVNMLNVTERNKMWLPGWHLCGQIMWYCTIGHQSARAWDILGGCRFPHIWCLFSWLGPCRHFGIHGCEFAIRVMGIATVLLSWASIANGTGKPVGIMGITCTQPRQYPYPWPHGFTLQNEPLYSQNRWEMVEIASKHVFWLYLSQFSSVWGV